MSKRAKLVAALVLLVGFVQVGEQVFAQVRPPRTGGGITPPGTTVPYLSPPATQSTQP